MGCGREKLPSLETASWPQKPITISCSVPAGEEADALFQLVTKLLNKEFPIHWIKVRMENRTSQSQAINYVAVRVRDGYNWFGFSESFLTASVLGETETTAKDWAFFILAEAPGVLSVPIDSDYNDLESFMKAAREKPQKLSVAASSSGGIWHLKLLSLQAAAGVEFDFFPHKKGQASHYAALSREADAVLSPISEQSKWIRNGQLRPLAMMTEEDFLVENLGNIPAAARFYPSLQKLPARRFLGFAIAADTHPLILQKIAKIFEKILNDDSLKKFCQDQLLSLRGWHGEEAKRRIQSAEQTWVWRLDELGMAVESPASFGIAKPK